MSVAEIVEEVDEPLIPENERPMLVSPNQMRLILGVSYTRLYRWSRYFPGFPVYRKGHSVLYPWARVKQFVDEHLPELPGRLDLEDLPERRKPKGKRT